MRYQANSLGAKRSRFYASGGEFCQYRGGSMGRFDVKNHNIGLDGAHGRHIWHLLQVLPQHFGVVIIDFEALYVVIEGINTCRSQDTGLPHAAAHHLSIAPRLPDEIGIAAKHRAHRGAQPFRQANRDGIE